jgi:bifunctional ADP-heptose synthase (sugar kinase/adenylyltransferase)
MAMGVLVMEVVDCGCGCQATKVYLVRGAERTELAEVATSLYVESQEVRDAFAALAAALGKAVIEKAGFKVGRPVEIRADNHH